MNVDPRDEFPRVSVNTYPDWQRIQAHYRHAALDSLDANIASNGLAHEKDALLFHLNKFIESTFAIAQPNLRVNGRPFEELDVNDQEMEPFDEVLDRSVWCLSDQRLRSDCGIADKRRDKPRQIESAYRDHLDHLQALDAKQTEESVHDDSLIEPDESLDLQEHQHTFERLSALAKELQQSIPSQRERSAMVKTVAAEVKSLRS